MTPRLIAGAALALLLFGGNVRADGRGIEADAVAGDAVVGGEDEDAGVRIVLIAPMLLGLPAFREFFETFPDFAILAHPAFGGAGRIAPVWLFGRFFRVLGADAIIYPNYGGRFAYNRDLCGQLAAAARAPWGTIRPMLPVPAGGMTLERVDEMIAFYGNDVMLLIGGGLLEAGDALPERSRAFVEKVTVR